MTNAIRYENLATLPNEHHPGVSSPATWTVYSIPSNPGLIFVRNPFTATGQRYWIARCLRDYPKAPHANNLKNIKSISPAAVDNWWHSLKTCPPSEGKLRAKLKASMRWATLGYHHDWDSKVYSESMKHKFPDDLNRLSQYFARALRLDDTYSAEAAIVNFYPFGTTLAGHTDHSEQNLDAPLFSYSFGQTAIFLIGGRTKDVRPTAVFLKSGDIAIMAKESRLCYHAVPKIMAATKEPWNDGVCADGDEAVSDDDADDQEIFSKKRKLNGTNDVSEMDTKLWTDVGTAQFWTEFGEYVRDCRININVRQVLKSGQRTLL